jgi:hypothetical protein
MTGHISQLQVHPYTNRLFSHSNQNFGVHNLTTLELLVQLTHNMMWLMSSPVPCGMHVLHSFDGTRILINRSNVGYFKYTQDEGRHSLDYTALPYDSITNAIATTELNFALACSDNSVHVHNSKTLDKIYVLLGGSMNPRLIPKSFVPNPSQQGASLVAMDDEKIVAVFGNLIRVYEFE